jgi:predicted nucleotidyltransferase
VQRKDKGIAIMDKEQALSIVRDYKKEVAKILNPSRVYMYGSYSKGTATENSDIDVAVVIPKLKGDCFLTVKKLWKVGRMVNSLIEPVLIEEDEPSPLYDEVTKWGIAVS